MQAEPMRRFRDSFVQMIGQAGQHRLETLERDAQRVGRGDVEVPAVERKDAPPLPVVEADDLEIHLVQQGRRQCADFSETEDGDLAERH